MKGFYITYRIDPDTKYFMILAKTPKSALKKFKAPHRGYMNIITRIEYDEILYVSEMVDGKEVRHLEKKYDSFSTNTSDPEGKRIYMKEYRKKYYQKNKDRIRKYQKEYHKEWYKNNRRSLCLK